MSFSSLDVLSLVLLVIEMDYSLYGRLVDSLMQCLVRGKKRFSLYNLGAFFYLAVEKKKGQVYFFLSGS